MRIQFTNFLALSSSAVLAERCPRTSNIWSIQNLRLHLAQKLSIAVNDILVNSVNETLDIGSCNCGGPHCFAASKTSIEFIMNGKVFDLLKQQY